MTRNNSTGAATLPPQGGWNMKTVYTVEISEEGLRSDGFYSIDSPETLFDLLKWYKETSDRPVTVRLRRHEVELPCDVCSAGSVREVIVLTLNK